MLGKVVNLPDTFISLNVLATFCHFLLTLFQCGQHGMPGLYVQLYVDVEGKLEQILKLESSKQSSSCNAIICSGIMFANLWLTYCYFILCICVIDTTKHTQILSS